MTSTRSVQTPSSSSPRNRATWCWRSVAGVAIVVFVLSSVPLLGLAAPSSAAVGSSGVVQLTDSFTLPNGLITNEYAFWNPTASARRTSPTWELTSGSLFARYGRAWSGKPDDIDPDASSSNGTDSAIFRMVTRRRDFSNVSVSFTLRRDRFLSTLSTPAVAWDGEHIFLRYSSEVSLYYVSFDRRDGTIAIKKKVAGGTSNGGTYYTLASGRNAFSAGVFHGVRATIVDTIDGSVALRLWVDGRRILSATDTGIGGPVIPTGGVGIRGDNTEFTFDDFLVTSL